MTPLFPNDNENVTINQGNTGDCYLLACLDCAFNLGSEGRNKVKSLFTQLADGSVELRIKRTPHSHNLRPAQISKKYGYRVDNVTGEDVFTISKDVCDNIDKAKGGVQSNSLAVKILERISSYYYVDPLEQCDVNASIIAHNKDDRYSGSPSKFVCDLLDIDARDTSNLDNIIKLKTINPNQPVYISIDYSKPHEHHIIRGYHALRINRIVKNGSSYDFYLINPWNTNGAEEKFTLDEIKKRNYRLSVINLDKQRQQLATSILACEEELGKAVFNKPELADLLLKIQQRFTLSTPQLEACIKLFQKTPYLYLLFNTLTPSDQDTMTHRMIQSDGNKAEFLKLLITRLPRREIIKFILKQDTSHEEIGQVLVDLATSKDGNQLKSVITSPDFFNLIYIAAIAHKKTISGENGKNEIDESLISYFFNRNPTYLTRTSGIRTLFTANIFTADTIKSLFSGEILLRNALVRVINSPIVLRYANNYIEQSSSDLVDDQLLMYLFLNSEAKTPRELFPALKKIYDINSEMGAKLFSLLAASCDNFTKISESIAQEESSTINTWFIKMRKTHCPSPEDKEEERQAQEVINNYVEQLNSFVVLPNSKTTLDEIKGQELVQMSELQAIIANKKDLIDAESVLGRTHINLALKAKQQLIKAATIQQRFIVENAEKTIEEFAHKILSLPISKLYDAKSLQALDEQVHYVLNLLNGYLKDSALNNAHQVLGLSSLHHKVELAKTRAQNFIANASEQRRETLLHAEKVISRYVHVLESFVAGLNNGQSLAEIEKIKESQFRKLDEIVLKNHDLNEAKKVLGIGGDQEHPQISKVINHKKALIVEAAKTQYRKIEAALKTVQNYVQKINEFQVEFINPTTPDLILGQSSALIKKLDQLILNKPDLEEALQILSPKTQHPDIVKALIFKKHQIGEKTKNLQYALNKQATDIIQNYADAISKTPVMPLRDAQTLSEIDSLSKMQEKQLIDKVNDSRDLIKAEQTLGFSSHHPVIKKALEEKREKILEETKRAKDKIISHNEALIVLERINFSTHISAIEDLTKQLEDNVNVKKDTRYVDAAISARILFEQLSAARRIFLESGKPKNANVQEFQTRCLVAIEAANEVLDEHRGWKQTLVDIANVLISLSTLFMVNLVTQRLRFFPIPPTNSGRITHEVEAVFQGITVEA